MTTAASFFIVVSLPFACPLVLFPLAPLVILHACVSVSAQQCVITEPNGRLNFWVVNDSSIRPGRIVAGKKIMLASARNARNGSFSSSLLSIFDCCDNATILPQTCAHSPMPDRFKLFIFFGISSHSAVDWSVHLSFIVSGRVRWPQDLYSTPAHRVLIQMRFS